MSEPVDPVAPVAPGTPGGPGNPWCPVDPVAPGTPVAPGGPFGPNHDAAFILLHCVSKKNDNDVPRYNFNAHQTISIIFGRDIAE